jgi:two-component system, OmpR family, response regulator
MSIVISVLLVEDDPMIGQGLVRALNDAGMSVKWIRDGNEGQVSIESGIFSLVLLDLGLPGKSGLDILKAMRACGNRTPTFIITAREKIDDLETGLDMGGDDYLIKPFSFNELLARIRRIVRWHGDGAAISNGEITLDLAAYKATYRGTTQLLSVKELALLNALLKRPGTVLSRSQIEKHLYGWIEEIESNVVEVLIHSLRKKFDCEIIRNVRGVGWMVVNNISCLP